MANCKNWCFTLNNPTENEVERIKLLGEDESINYLIFQKEHGENNTEHLQGYIQFAAKKRLGPAKAAVSERAHLEKARGTPDQNKTYCTKEEGRLDGPWEYGIISIAGKRSDLLKFRDAMKVRILSDAEVVEDFPEVIAKYPRFVKLVRDTYEEAQVDDPALTPLRS